MAKGKWAYLHLIVPPKLFPRLSLVSLSATVFQHAVHPCSSRPSTLLFTSLTPLFPAAVTFDPFQLACVSGTCLSKTEFFVFVYPLFGSCGPFLRLMGLFD